MRKVLAIILAVAMLATLIPAAFASETSEEEKITIVCDIQNLAIENNMLGDANPLPPFSTLNYETTGGKFRYIRSSLTDADNQPFNNPGNEVPQANKIAYRSSSVGADTNGGYFSVYAGHHISFEVNVPQDGIYTLKFNHKYGKNSAAVKVYMTDADAFYNNGSFGAEQNTIATLDNSTSKDPVSINTTDWRPDVEIFKEKNLLAGKYIITYEAIASVTLWKACIGSFTLEGTPIEEEPEEKAVIYNVAKTMRDNGIYYVSPSQDAAAEAEKMTYEMTNGLFEVTDARGVITVGGTGGTVHNFFKIKQSATIDFKVNIPEDGKYYLRANHQLAQDGAPVSVFVDGEIVGEYDCYGSAQEDGAPASFASGSTSVWKNNDVVTEDGIDLSAGEHSISFSVRSPGYGMISYFELVNNDLSTDNVSLVYVDDTNLEIGEEATISGAVVSSLDGTVKEKSNESTRYTSSNPSVVTVSGTKITAIGAGTADITATIGGVTASRSVTVADPVAPVTISYAESNNVDDEIEIKSGVARGANVTVSAPEKEGYTFRHWVRGTEESGNWVSSDAEYTFKIVTNTYLTAIYTKTAAEDEKIVEFFNGNGEYITQKTVENGKVKIPENPQLTGFGFSRWIVAEDTEFANENITAPLTRVVAEFVSLGKTITVEGTPVEYDEVITKNSDSGEEVAWYRDSVLVGYGSTYEYNAWADVNSITEAPIKKKVPVVVLDGTAKESARMIEYDAGDKEIVEVGILFGDTSAKPNVDSCKYKATSRNSGTGLHGQFTAKPADATYTNARGYLIYKDNGTFRVIYAD